MKKVLVLSALVVMTALSIAQADEAKEKQAIQKRSDEWNAAWNKHDPKLMAAFFTEDGDMMNPFGRHAKGPAEIEKVFTDEQTGKGPMVGTTYTGVIDNVRFIGKDVAVVDVTGEVNGMMGPDGKPAPAFKHHVTWVAEKKGGKWMAVAARASVPMPAPGRPNSQSNPNSESPTRRENHTMSKMQKMSMAQPDEKRAFDKGLVELVTLGGVTFGRATLQPGWKWSTCVKPLVKTQSCEAPHLQYHVSGRLHVVMDNGAHDEFGPGDVSLLPPGHDAWVVGNEPAVISGMVDYAKKK